MIEAIIAEISAPHRASCEDCSPQSSTDCTLDRDNMPSREKWYKKNLCFLAGEKHLGRNLGNRLGMLSCKRKMRDPCKGRDDIHDINSAIPGARNQKAQRLNQ